MWTGTLAKAGKKRQVNLKVFDFSNNDMVFFCRGNLFAMLTLSPHLSLPSKIPMRAVSSRLHLTAGEPAPGSSAAARGRSGSVPAHRPSAKRKSSAKRLLYMNGSVSSSGEGVISAGMRQCAWKAIWARATCLDGPSCLPLVSSPCWTGFRQLPRIGCHSTAPQTPIVYSSFMHSLPNDAYPFVQVAKCPPITLSPTLPLHGHPEQHVLTQGTSPRSAM